MAEVLGVNRPAALCRELTKTFEEVLRGNLGELAARLNARAKEPGGIRGEFVIVIGPAMPDAVAPSWPELEAAARTLTESGTSLKDAVATVAAAHGVSKRELYNHCLAVRSGKVGE